jgi:hypothetical protein
MGSFVQYLNYSAEDRLLQMVFYTDMSSEDYVILNIGLFLMNYLRNCTPQAIVQISETN